MHLDQKEDGASRRQRRSDRDGERKSSYGRDRRFDDGGRRGGRDDRSYNGRGRNDRDNRGSRNRSSRPNIHVATERNSQTRNNSRASMYKKGSKKAERF